MGCRLISPLLKAGNSRLDGFEVGEHAAQPAVYHIVLSAALRFKLHRFLRLLLRANKQNGLSRFRHLADKHISLFCFLNCFLKVDDVNPVALGEDVLLHLGVPSSGLVPEMNTCFKHLLHRNY